MRCKALCLLLCAYSQLMASEHDLALLHAQLMALAPSQTAPAQFHAASMLQQIEELLQQGRLDEAAKMMALYEQKVKEAEEKNRQLSQEIKSLEGKLQDQEPALLSSTFSAFVKEAQAHVKKNDPKVSLISADDFSRLAEKFYQTQRAQIKAEGAWTNDNRITSAHEFQPFVQKVMIPKGSRLFIFGDLHGDLEGFVHILEELHKQGAIDHNFIIQKDAFFVFDGDFVDRGKYGVEVVALLWLLKIKNPTQVFLARGNHEDIDLVFAYGFVAELVAKFGKERAESLLYNRLIQFWNTIPVAIFVGEQDHEKSPVEYVYCFHGGVELGYNPIPFLENCHKRFDRIQKFTATDNLNAAKKASGRKESYCTQEPVTLSRFVRDKDGTIREEATTYTSREAVRQHFVRKDLLTTFTPSDMDHLWGDFEACAHTKPSLRGAGCVYGQHLTEDFLAWINKQKPDKFHILAIFRAHQPAIAGFAANAGLYKLCWSTSIFTTHATHQKANTPGPTFVELIAQGHDWKLTHHWYDLQIAKPVWKKRTGTVITWKNVE